MGPDRFWKVDPGFPWVLGQGIAVEIPRIGAEEDVLTQKTNALHAADRQIRANKRRK